MPAFVRAEDLIGPITRVVDLPGGGRELRVEDDVVEFSDDPAVLRKFWGIVLCLAVRDDASSIEYHPWRADGGLAYVVDNVRYVLRHPPPEWAGPIVAAARSLVTPAGHGLRARLTRWTGGGIVTGTLAFAVAGWLYEWDVVCWSSGERVGVEFFRVSPPVADTTPAPREESSS
jgi:hypothetical protein